MRLPDGTLEDWDLLDHRGAAACVPVMDDGRIAGCGTHEVLMRDCGVYRAICLSQQSAEVSA